VSGNRWEREHLLSWREQAVEERCSDNSCPECWRSQQAPDRSCHISRLQPPLPLSASSPVAWQMGVQALEGSALCAEVGTRQRQKIHCKPCQAGDWGLEFRLWHLSQAGPGCQVFFANFRTHHLFEKKIRPKKSRENLVSICKQGHFCCSHLPGCICPVSG